MADITTKPMTDEDLLRLPRGMGEKHELIEGELIVMPPPGNRHGLIVGVILGVLFNYLKQNQLGVVVSETGFYTRGTRYTVRGPDVGFIRNEDIPEDGLPDGYSAIVPALVVEVISPNDTASEVEDKTQEWLRYGVQVVWNVYPKNERIYIYKQGEQSPTVLTAEDTLMGGDVLPQFEIAVSEIFQK